MAGMLGALLLGAHDPAGLLRDLGNVGTGFTKAALRALLVRLEPLRRLYSPFDEGVPREHARGVTWVAAQLVGEVLYCTLTSDQRPHRGPDEVVLDLLYEAGVACRVAVGLPMHIRATLRTALRREPARRG